MEPPVAISIAPLSHKSHAICDTLSRSFKFRILCKYLTLIQLNQKDDKNLNGIMLNWSCWVHKTKSYYQQFGRYLPQGLAVLRSYN